MEIDLSSKNPTAIICLSPNSGGMEIDTIKLAKKLSPYTPITLIARKGYFIANSKDDYVGFNNICLETISFYYSFSLSIIFHVRQIIKDKNIKNIIFLGASELKSLYFSCLGLDINLIIRHGTTKSSPKKDLFHRLIYSNVNYHVAICKHLQKNIDYIIPFGKNTKKKLIYSSVNLSDYCKIKSNKLTILNVGRIEAGKGQYDAIKACEILYKNSIDFIFYIVGNIEPQYKNSFLNFYNSLPYRDRIVLVGHTQNTIEYYNKADLFLFPSYGEGLSNAFLEALACGLDCIAYSNTSFPELKALGLDFHLVENKNIEQLSNILLHCALNPSVHNSNIANISANFALQTEIQQYLEILS